MDNLLCPNRPDTVAIDYFNQCHLQCCSRIQCPERSSSEIGLGLDMESVRSFDSEQFSWSRGAIRRSV